jgi:hypothetical protein
MYCALMSSALFSLTFTSSISAALSCTPGLPSAVSSRIVALAPPTSRSVCDVEELEERPALAA